MEQQVTQQETLDKDAGNKTPRMRSRRSRPPVDLIIDYKDPEGLRQYVSDEGKMVPRRLTRMSAKQQAKLSREIKRARTLALLSYGNQR